MSRRRNRAQTHDSWMNPTTGVGGPSDKSGNFIFYGGTHLLWDDYRLEQLYEASDLAGRIVDAIPDECFKRGWAVKLGANAKEVKGAVDDALDTLKVREKVQEAMRWARLFGGSAILLGADDGPPHTPLNPGAVTRLHFLTTFERRELTPITWGEDPLAPNFGEPEHYRVTPLSASQTPLLYVHRSRLIMFNGVKTTRRRLVENLGFGSSVLFRALKVMSQIEGGFATALALMADANQNVYALKGLSQIIASGREDLLKTRLAVLEKFRSAINAIALDADGEQFIRSTLSLAGVHEILDKLMIRMAAAAEMPVTVLFGQSPAGMNATGESDSRNWFARVLQEQRDVAKPALERVLRLLFRSKQGPTAGADPDSWSVEFPSLWEPTAREQADIGNIHAQTDQTYIDLGILKPVHVAKARFRGEDGDGRPLLSDTDIAELQGTLEPQGATGSETNPAKAAAVQALSQLAGVDTTTEDSDDLTDEDVTALAQKMTEHNVARCEHNCSNRCRMCGIERVRDFETGDDGNPAWHVKWRPIRA